MTKSDAPLMVTDMVYIAPSSTYMVRSLKAHVLIISSRLAVYIVDNMGDRGEPYGVSLMISKDSETCLLPLSVAVLEDKKDSVQAHMLGGKPLSQNICTAHAGFTLSKKPEISKRRRALTRFTAWVACMQCIKAVVASIAEWCSWDPNWVMGKSSCA